MTTYNITFYNDMGHLLITPPHSQIPEHIQKFCYEKANMYLYYATDNKNLGCRFYILKHGYKKEWTYYYGTDIINITYNTDIFNPQTMIKL